MRTTVDRWWLWVIINLIGMAAFLYFAVETWIEPELANEPGTSGGEFMVWGVSALPIFLFFMLAHFGISVATGFERRRSGSWRGELFLGVTLLCWFAVFAYDNSHHGS